LLQQPGTRSGLLAQGEGRGAIEGGKVQAKWRVQAQMQCLKPALCFFPQFLSLPLHSSVKHGKVFYFFYLMKAVTCVIEGIAIFS